MSFGCIICHRAPPEDDVALIRLNVKGESGLWACQDHRKEFLPGLQPTTEVLERAMGIKARTFS